MTCPARRSSCECHPFPPLCPDFVAELRDGTDSLDAPDAKMQEYLDSGARLGWLIDPEDRRVYIYRVWRQGRQPRP